MKIKVYGALAALLISGVVSNISAQTKETFLKDTKSENLPINEEVLAFSDTFGDKNSAKKRADKLFGKSDDKKPNEEETAEKTSKAVSSECESCRWFEPTAATFSLRYRTVTDATNLRTFNQNQQRIVLAGKFKFDKEGKYTINVHASSGYYFNWAYADTGWGNVTNDVIYKAAPGIASFVVREVAPPVVQSTVANFIAANYPTATPEQIAQLTPILTAQFTPIVNAQVQAGLEQEFRSTNTRTKGWNLFVRQLYFQAKPIKGLEFQYGSLPINKGVNSEATSYDDDGYVMGGRVSLKRPKQFFFDELSATYAYFGEIFTPNFFRRTERFKQSNYHQFLVRKKLFNGKVDVSADYTFQDGSDTMREGVVVEVKKSKIFDVLRFESYQRIGDNVVFGKTFKSGNGFYASAEKTIADRLTLNGGISSIDRQYTVYGEYTTKGLDFYGFALNGDQTGVGKRFIGKANYKLAKDLSISMLYSHAFANDSEGIRYYWNKTHFNVAVTYDVLKAVKRLGWFK